MLPTEWNPRNSDSPADKPKPHFCATMFQFPIPEHKLMIPTKSAMIFGKELFGVVTLTDPNGLTWKVGLEEDGEEIWLHDGLQEFFDYYAVHCFYNLHFRYEGNSVFFVCICDAFGSEIDYPCDGPSRDVKHNEEDTIGDYSIEFWDINPPISDHGLFVKHVDVTRVDESVEILDVKPSISSVSAQGKPFSGDVEQRCSSKIDNFLSQEKICRPTKRCRNAASTDTTLHGDACHARSRTLEQLDPEGLVDGCTSKRGKPRENKKPHPPSLAVKNEEYAKMHVPRSLLYAKSRLVISKETEEAVRIASVCKLENPSFMVILRAHNFTEKHVDVPAEFVKRHMTGCSEHIHLQVRNGKHRWPVRCFYIGSRNKNGSRTVKKIGKGWVRFLTDNNLQVGDVCVFELTKKGNDIVLRVWIYCAADVTRPKNDCIAVTCSRVEVDKNIVGK